MKILLFGATGLAGGVLRACLASPEVTEVRAVVRRSTGVRDPKLREIEHYDYSDYAAIAGEFGALCWRPAMIGGTPCTNPPLY